MTQSSKDIFKSKLDGTFVDLLYSAYAAGYSNGFDDGAFSLNDTVTPQEVTDQFRAWLKEQE